MLNRQLRRVQDRSKSAAQRQKAARARKAAAQKRGEKKGIFKRIAQFMREVRVEMKKVIWPSRKEVVDYTIVVLITVTVVTTFILVLDLVLSKLLQIIT